jgi:predicted Zn-dependent peptidase
VLKARDKIAAVTSADIQRVATAYFTKSNRTVATLVKKTGEKKIVAVPQREVAR